MDNVPVIPLDIIEYLERVFPDKAPGPKESLDDIRVKTGAVLVHRHLRAKYDEQMQNFASTTIKCLNRKFT